MIEGECPVCGRRYYGWALREFRNQRCNKCGVDLLLTKDDGEVYKGYSPLEAIVYSIDLVKFRKITEYKLGPEIRH